MVIEYHIEKVIPLNNRGKKTDNPGTILYEAVGIIKTSFIQLILYALIGINVTVLGSCQVLDESISVQIFFHDEFHFDVSKRRNKLILHQILDI